MGSCPLTVFSSVLWRPKSQASLWARFHSLTLFSGVWFSLPFANRNRFNSLSFFQHIQTIFPLLNHRVRDIYLTKTFFLSHSDLIDNNSNNILTKQISLHVKTISKYRYLVNNNSFKKLLCGVVFPVSIGLYHLLTSLRGKKSINDWARLVKPKYKYIFKI